MASEPTTLSREEAEEMEREVSMRLLGNSWSGRIYEEFVRAGYERGVREVRAEINREAIAWAASRNFDQGTDEATALHQQRHDAVKDALGNIYNRLDYAVHGAAQPPKQAEGKGGA